MFDKLVILIPAYEPEEKFIKLLQELNEKNLKVIVINDGSDSNYDEIFNEAKKYSIVIKQDVNKGKGAALKTGLKYIEENIKDDYVVVTMDCDGQHTLNDALKIGKYAIENSEELVLGKRLRSNKTPLRSRIGNGITRLIYRLKTKVDVYDTQTGLRAFSNKLIPFMLSVEGDKFEYEMNVLLQCPINKIKIKEIEIETIYIDNNSHSHFNALRDSKRIYSEIFNFKKK